MSFANAGACTARSNTRRANGFLQDVLDGLSAAPKSVPCKYLYDKRGSELFDQICELPEYYVTRTELAIMRQHSQAMAQAMGRGVTLVEYGSGSSIKTRLLLNQLDTCWSYVPVDVSGQHLQQSCQTLRAEYPSLEVNPVSADFTQPFKLPQQTSGAGPVVVYFPGSTIGNLTHDESCRLLANTRRLCGAGGQMLVGIDLQKDPQVIHDAYNDAQGVTAEFNQNLLRRMNRELGANFDLAGFQFQAVYNRRKGRVESAQVSLKQQQVTLGDQAFAFEEGELLRTEYSHKYTIPQFERLAQEAGFLLAEQWTDPQNYFAVLLLQAQA